MLNRKPLVQFINKSKTVIDLDKMLNAMYGYVTDLYDVWGVTCDLAIAKNLSPKAWGMVFLDDADEANALGYHDVTVSGLPLSKVFVNDTLKAKEELSVTASHELAEMLVDPFINLCAFNGGVMYAYEVCDAVEEDTYVEKDVELSNFVLPEWFEGFRKVGTFDFLGKLKKPFTLRPGGYMPVFKNGRWTQIFGSEAKKKRFAKENRAGHRSEYRGK